MKFLLKIVLLVAAVALCAPAEPISSLHATNYVNDFAGVLDAETVAQLNALCQEVDEKAKAQIAVVTVKSLDGQEAVDYGVALYQAWGIGAKSTNRGVLILVATQDHKYYTNVGYGLEPLLPDGKVGGFGREMVPILRTGNYNAAVTLMTNRVASVIAQDAGVTLENAPTMPNPPPQQRPPANDGAGIGVLAFILIIVVILLMFRGGRSLLWFLLGMFLGSGGGSRGGYGGGGFSGGFGGGGGGGFGGFGGGSTGGGGAGGSW